MIPAESSSHQVTTLFGNRLTSIDPGRLHLTLFSHKQWINNGPEWVLYSAYSNWSRGKKNSELKPTLLRFKKNWPCIATWRCLWCNGYRRRKWTRRHEFKSWTRLIAFHIALIPLGKVWIQLFSLQLWVNSRADWFFSLDEATSLEVKLWIQTC